VKPLAIRGSKALGHERLNTGTQFLSDITTKEREIQFKNILADRLAESAQGLVTKQKEGGRKRKAADTSSPPHPKKKKAEANLRKKKQLPPKKNSIEGDIFF